MFIVEGPSGTGAPRLPSQAVAAGPTFSAQVAAYMLSSLPKVLSVTMTHNGLLWAMRSLVALVCFRPSSSLRSAHAVGSAVAATATGL
jgi:hypothetical protein